ncbi:Mtw1 kinetochore complex, DSN1 [Beauveria brongniartii RCEF 3172]|uniref:Mtw1 kinetochore complex, DSN1 n=1 Tax=Beauveria brongniartii RCEF 3172 TaxID=1081107 RepID=A0A166ZCN0_9HYPO|nr:Mtw1 kinetochore complex, DSN1 [Beauveria brongniartii RCEF 3172]
MTTLVAIRTSPLDLSMSNQPDRRTGKRLAGEQRPEHRATMVTLIREDAAADDLENDDDFVFTRKPKKARTDEVTATATAAPVRRSPRHKSAAADSSKTTTTRSSSSQKKAGAVSSPSRDADRRRREASAGRAASSHDPRTDRTTRRADAERATKSSFQSPPPRGTTTITLPTSDTPVMARNKEMRKKAAEGAPQSSASSSNGSGNGSNHRRSSLGTRGRRASSLIESGQTAIPHRDLDAQDFYKHIASDGLLESMRMKQLLTWCGERALPEKPKQGVPSTDPSLGARAILDELLKEFSTRPEFTNWLGRDESVAPATRILKPNPRNIELDKKRASLEARIQRLQEEKNAWLSIQKRPPDQPQLFPPDDASQEIRPKLPPPLPALDLLDADEGRIHRYLAAELEPLEGVRARAQSRLQAVQATLEFEVDHLADSVHKLEQRRREDRERRGAGTREMPMMEVLRSLGSLLPEGGGPGL